MHRLILSMFPRNSEGIPRKFDLKLLHSFSPLIISIAFEDHSMGFQQNLICPKKWNNLRRKSKYRGRYCLQNWVQMGTLDHFLILDQNIGQIVLQKLCKNCRIHLGWTNSEYGNSSPQGCLLHKIESFRFGNVWLLILSISDAHLLVWPYF